MGPKPVDIPNERRQLAATIPPDRTEDLARARQHLAAAEADWHDLHRGAGRWTNTAIGAAARDLVAARQAHAAALQATDQPNLTRVQQLTTRVAEQKADRALRRAEREWAAVSPATVNWAGRMYHQAHAAVTGLEAAQQHRTIWLSQHPELLHRLDELSVNIAELRDQQRQLDRRLDLSRTINHAIDRGHGLGR